MLHMKNLSQLTQQLIASAKSAGADAADALAVDGTSLSVEMRDGKLEQAERSEGVEMGLRVLVGKRQACVSASDIQDSTIAEMGERAVAMARLAPEDPYVGLADADQLSSDLDSSELELAEEEGEPDPASLQSLAAEAEAAALEFEGISQVQTATAGHSRHNIHLAASNGFSGGYNRTGNSLYCVAIAGEGTAMERDYFGESRIHRGDLPDAIEVGRIAAERAVSRQGARRAPTGTFPVLYDERISSGLIGHLLSAANGSAISRGSSWLQDLLGKQVLPAHLSITENPHRPRISGSRMFDAEGLATKERTIVENGVLQGWTLDLATARKLGMESTANAARGTSAPPSPSNTNIALTQGDVSQEQLLKAMGTGLFVTSLIGSSINPTTGDYSRGASGFWVENGEITHPVNECTIAGNLLDMLMRIQPANDARTHMAHVVPSLLVEGLTIAGE